LNYQNIPLVARRQNIIEGIVMDNHKVRTSLIVTFIFTFTGVFFAQQAAAQSSYRFAGKGTVELGGSVSYQRSTVITQGTEFPSQTSSIFSFFPYAGYFLADGFEIGLNPLSVQTYWDSQDKITNLTILLAPSYNFDTGGKVFPFVEAQLGYSQEVFGGSLADLNPSKRDGFSWGGRAGIKFAISGNSLLNVGAQYQQITLTPSGDTQRSGSNILMFSAGFTFWM
jgi:Outer membrane protein beta-barrel domain